MNLAKLPAPRAILFDLDGTLADTAPDLIATANRLRARRGMQALPAAQLRPTVSQGVRGVLELALQTTPDQSDYLSLQEEFMGHYAARVCLDTALFAGMAEVLAQLEAQQILWGVVTNKITRFTEPLLQQLGLFERAQVIVSGDTTAHAKPHPAPLLHAAAQLMVPPQSCWYVGDDVRDIEAGQVAEMQTIAVTYGYGLVGALIAKRPNSVIHQPLELIRLLQHGA